MYYFKQVENGIITSVEAKTYKGASPGFVSMTKGKYDAFIASLPMPESLPGRNLEAEFDNLVKRVKALEAK